MRKLVFLVLFSISLTSYSQTENREQWLIDLLENNTDEKQDISYLYDHFNNLLKNPIDINNASFDELTQSYLFTPQQAIELIEFRTVYKEFVEVNEIRTLKSISSSTANFINNFISVSSLPLSFHFKDGEHYLVSNYAKILQEQKGYSDGTYLGPSYSNSFRYRYQNTNWGSFGYIIDKDAGEQIQLKNNPTNLGYDFASYHLFIQPKHKNYSLAVGNYALQLGQGLHIWNGFGFSKSVYATSINKHEKELRPYTSINEVNNLKGAAVSYGNKINTLVFYSEKKLDANISDSNTFSSFQTTGLHRTQTEIENKNTVTETLTGARISYRKERLKAGITYSNTSFFLPIQKSDTRINRFQFEGSSFSNTSIDYNYYGNRIELFGENVVHQTNSFATINGIKLHHSSKVNSAFAYRNFSPSYFTRYHNVLSENTNPQNEKGVYYGVEISPTPLAQLLFYADYYSFQWLKQEAYTPSKGVDYLGQLRYSISPFTTIYFRLKLETKEKNESVYEYTYPVSAETVFKNRIQLNHQISENLTGVTRIEFAKITQENSASNNGFLMYEDINWSNRKFTIHTRYAIFNSSSFDSGIYAFENDIRYSFSVLNYAYWGTRYYVVAKYHIKKHVDIWMKYAHTSYTDRETNGSGYNEINANQRTEIKLQLILQL